jgi:hypothetical protein
MPPRTPARQSRPDSADLARTAPGLVKKAHSDSAVGFLEFGGEKYQLSAEQGVWPLLQFARAAEAGFRTNDSRGLAAIHAFLEDVIDPGDWGRFQEDMIKNKVVDLEKLMKAAQQAVNDQLERMEQRQSNGSAPEQE